MVKRPGRSRPPTSKSGRPARRDGSRDSGREDARPQRAQAGQKASGGRAGPDRSRTRAEGGSGSLAAGKPKRSGTFAKTRARLAVDGSDGPARPQRQQERRSAAKPAAAPARSGSTPTLPRTPPRRGATSGPAGPAEPMRIARAMARAGLCSRREAERWIEEGRVTVNGKRLTTPAVEVGPGDKVLVDGVPLPAAEPVRLWRYHKPRGLVTTNSDPEGRPTVFDNLPEDLPRVVSVGRLDFNTEGLLLLTNDGGLSRHLELPSTGWLRRYRVRAWGDVTQERLDKLKDGLDFEGVRYGPIEATLDTVQGHNVWLTLGLREGKNREVRNVMSALGLEVNRLIRISYGPFQLSELKPGEAEPVRRRVLIDQLGLRLARDLGISADDEDGSGDSRAKRRAGRGGQRADD